jgi:epoxyqueuosine reductase
MSITDDIKKKALELGFDLVGITDTSPIDNEQVKLLLDWLKSGFAGRMSYLKRNLQMRIKPAKLLEDAQSVIVVGLNYKPPIPHQLSAVNPQINLGAKPVLSKVESEPTGKVTSYAQYEDYHLFIKKQLHKLIDFISSADRTVQKFKICVDSAPVPERALAARAGLGFIGKNHMLINPMVGPQIFLGEIITTLKLRPDKPIANNCSNCHRCIDACPTKALRADGQFDANKCISYLTIEYKGLIPPDLAKKIGDRLFGCDECVLACPYQQNAPICKNKQFKFYDDRVELDLQDILQLTEEQFERRFADSVIKRLGLAGLQRNAHICLANI